MRFRWAIACAGIYADAGDGSESDDSMSDSGDDMSSVSSDSDDEAAKNERLQLMVMKTAKGIAVQDLLTPRGDKSKKKKKKEEKDGAKPSDAAAQAAAAAAGAGACWYCDPFIVFACWDMVPHTHDHHMICAIVVARAVCSLFCVHAAVIASPVALPLP